MKWIIPLALITGTVLVIFVSKEWCYIGTYSKSEFTDQLPLNNVDRQDMRIDWEGDNLVVYKKC